MAACAVALAFVAAFGAPGSGSALAQGSEVPEPPKLQAKSWVLVDAESGEVLLGKEQDRRLPMASTAKIMSVLVALNEGVDLNEEVTISENAASYARPPYSNAGLYPFDQINMQELLDGVLVPSGIDAVYALAEEYGGGSAERFVEMMNEEAEALDLENTRFQNPAGIDAPNQYSSARDLAVMAHEASEYPVFRDTVDNIEATITTQDRKIELVNTNLLLQTYIPATGIKTGTTVDAGENLVASATQEGESYIAVTLGSTDRYTDSQVLLEYAFDRYEERPLVEQDKVYSEADLPYRRDESIKLEAGEEVAALVDEGSKVERRLSTEEMPPSAEAGEQVGSVEVLVDGRSVGESPLVAAESYEEASIWQKARYVAGGWMRGLGRWMDGLAD